MNFDYVTDAFISNLDLFIFFIARLRLALLDSDIINWRIDQLNLELHCSTQKATEIMIRAYDGTIQWRLGMDEAKVHRQSCMYRHLDTCI